MNKIFTYALLCLFICCFRSNAQGNKFDNVWIQGESVIYSTLFNGVNTPLNQKLINGPIYFEFGNSNICDSLGKVVFICDGYNIYDTTFQYMDGGDTLVPHMIYDRYYGWSGYSQSSIILPFRNGIYRVITPTASDSEMINYWWNHPEKGRALFDLLLYHEVDMKANGGRGEVTKRMVPLLEDVKLSKTQMMACRAGDGQSWWLLKQASDTNMVYKFLFTEDGIFGPFIQGFAEPHFTKWDICGQAMFSQDGMQYATTIQGARKVFVADFDRCSGYLSHPRIYNVPLQLTGVPYDSTERDSSTCGLAFSPNGRFLYVNGFFSVQQLDLENPDSATAWTKIGGMDTTWDQFQLYSNIYPGPDGKLYIGNWNGFAGQMSVINSPDQKGITADFCPKCLRFPGHVSGGVVRFAGVSTPPCMPNYHLGATTPPCYPTGVRPPEEREQKFLLYPNPTHGTVALQYEQPGLLLFYDVLGRVAGSFSLPSTGREAVIDLSFLQPGVYQYLYQSKGGYRVVGKLVLAP